MCPAERGCLVITEGLRQRKPGRVRKGRSEEPQSMSTVMQLVAMLILLAYSAIYLFFVAWASERTTGTPLVRKLKLTAFLGGAFLPIVAILILLLPG